MSSEKAPHRAIVHMTVELCDVLPTGESSGRVVPNSKLKEHGISRNILVSVEGFDFSDCVNKLKEKLDAFKSKV